MLEADNIVFEQFGAQLISNGSKYFGKLRLIEKGELVIIEWISHGDEANESDWEYFSSPDKFCDHNTSRSPSVDTVPPVSLYLSDITCCKFYDGLTKLKFLKRNNILAEIHLLHDTAESFFDHLANYISLKRHPTHGNQIMFQNKEEASMDDQLSAMHLVKNTRRHNFRSPTHENHLRHIAAAPKKVFGFLQGMHRDPYKTAVDTFTHVYDSILYGGIETTATEATAEDNIVDLLRHISGVDDDESGFEILTLTSDMAPKPSVERWTPLGHDEYKAFFDEDGRIGKSTTLKERVLRGGISPTVRSELWCFLLDVYKWNSTTEDRRMRRIEIKEEYFVMKRQWLTITKSQETNFGGYRERKSIVEKDVNRTDRCHPFYEGEDNNNLVKLNDILMTYVMYNFDLGYVQGMSDLLAPILYIIEDEAIAFWCFVGFMNLVYRNFDLDQSGMKEQLVSLTKILAMVDPEFLSFLETQDSANMTFCFRWLLVRFKRELNYSDTLRVWEILWTGLPCPNFTLLIATAILCKQRDIIISNKFGFAEILKHVNGLAFQIDIEECLAEAEALYLQLKATEGVSNTLREILGLPLKDEMSLEKDLATPNPARSGPGQGKRILQEPSLKRLEDQYDNAFDP